MDASAASALPAPPPVPIVLVYSQGRKAAGGGHELDTQWELARQIAELKGAQLAGNVDDACIVSANRYLVPDDTLTVDEARKLGVASERDLYGGVVPYPFVATKLIAHELPPGARHAPHGWSREFSEQVRGLVLPGYAAFSRDDALDAAALLWPGGRVRIKRPYGIGGAGQALVETGEQLAAELDDIGDAALQTEGVVVERHLENIETLSVGRVTLDGLVASYHGVQRLTVNNHGHHVYGGSDLVVVRGDFDALARLDMADDVREAIARARAFDACVQKYYAGFYASRRNYDVGWGADANGTHYCGVLEQSWRLGGASGAEIGALRVLQADRNAHTVRASTWEIYGAHAEVPADACLIYHGTDPQAGEITKFYTVDGSSET